MHDEAAVKDWFCTEVLPLETELIKIIRKRWRPTHEHADVRQEIYARLLEAAMSQLPINNRAFVFTVAHNHLVDRARRARIVSFEQFLDLDRTSLAADVLTPERIISAREELARLKQGIERLPERCRQVFILRRIRGYSQKETAESMGISVKAVEQQMTKGMIALADFMLSGGDAEKANAPLKKPRRKGRGQ